MSLSLGMAAAALPAVRQLAGASAAAADQSLWWLALGAAGGVAYTLGTEKYVRAMQHRHIYVRASMLYLSGVCWLGAALVMVLVSTRIFWQAGAGLEGGANLEGFDRLLGVLIPVVVRADLIVDWARRVSWALLNLRYWVEASVALQRILARTAVLRATTPLRVSRDVDGLAAAAVHARGDVVAAESSMWEADVSLVRIGEIMKHFRKLARISAYGTAIFFGSIPACCLWIVYAVFRILRALQQRQPLTALLYVVSIVFAPLGAVISIVASACLVIGVVSLSVAGTLIQFGVYWSVRITYLFVRALLSEHWAGFPLVSHLHLRAESSVQLPEIDPSGRAETRHPAEAAAAMSRFGDLFPTEMEFVLSPWDGSVDANDDKYCDESDLLDTSLESSQSKKDGSPRRSMMPLLFKKSSTRTYTTASSTGEDDDADPDSFDNKNADMHRHLELLARLGLDASVDTRRKRRLTIYYSLGLLTMVQLESGGQAFRLPAVSEMSDSEYLAGICEHNSFVADEASQAVDELASRLRRTSRFRNVHSGAAEQELGDVVSITVWLRSLLLFLLSAKVEAPSTVGVLVRQEKRRMPKHRASGVTPPPRLAVQSS